MTEQIWKYANGNITNDSTNYYFEVVEDILVQKKSSFFSVRELNSSDFKNIFMTLQEKNIRIREICVENYDGKKLNFKGITFYPSLKILNISGVTSVVGKRFQNIRLYSYYYEDFEEIIFDIFKNKSTEKITISYCEVTEKIYERITYNGIIEYFFKKGNIFEKEFKKEKDMEKIRKYLKNISKIPKNSSNYLEEIKIICQQIIDIE